MINRHYEPSETAGTPTVESLPDRNATGRGAWPLGASGTGGTDQNAVTPGIREFLPTCRCNHASPLHNAATPRSWLRMRITSSTLETKILPSPIFPVPADCRIASTAG